ncbi:unnamed protein product [Paramecium sonneborni]|uniref:Uncharacterized protein n=1 Tax=Paramecium sonneborni TaxID=65129 RepID=A0A8S1R5C4_9CILI|nr:unnamed protein product [Paramecium sonneborni]
MGSIERFQFKKLFILQYQYVNKQSNIRQVIYYRFHQTLVYIDLINQVNILFCFIISQNRCLLQTKQQLRFNQSFYIKDLKDVILILPSELDEIDIQLSLQIHALDRSCKIDTKYLAKEYKFETLKQAFVFMNTVSHLADQMNRNYELFIQIILNGLIFIIDQMLKQPLKILVKFELKM